MNLDPFEVGYFITQVGLSAASFGVTTDDVTAVGMALSKTFDYRCEPPATVVPSQGPDLQSICLADTCPLSPNATCSMYANNGVSMEPVAANATNNATAAANSTTASSSPSASKSSATTLCSGAVLAVLIAAAISLIL